MNTIQRTRIFKSDVLEAFTRTSPTITIVTYGTIVALFLYLNDHIAHFSFGQTIVLYICGLFFWTLFEYVMHRYVFHWISDSEVSKHIHYAIHGVHHESPRDVERLFMPPLPGSIIIGLVFLFFYLLLGNYTFAFMAAFVCGYMVYVFVHYTLHSHRPIKPFKFLWRHHALHHYKYQNKAFGVSSPLWDYIFGTMPPKD